jgi:hypothetical protein
MMKRKIKKLFKKVSKNISAFAGKVFHLSGKLFTEAKGHKLPLLNTALLLWLVYRLEEIRSFMQAAAGAAAMLYINLIVAINHASLQFESAIYSILSLFGGTDS